MSLLIAAIIPVIAFLYVVYRKDTIKEPVGLLTKCFFGGCLSILLTLVIVYMLFPSIEFSSPALNAFYQAFFHAAIPEESAKFIILYLLVWNSEEFDQHYDGIIYAVFVSMGFALVENIVYVFNYGYATAFTRGLLAVPVHGLCGICMGYFFSLARFVEEDIHRRYLFYSLSSAVVLHGLYDFILMYIDMSQLSTGLTAVLFVSFLILIAFQWKIGAGSIRKHLAKDKEIIYHHNLQENKQHEEISNPQPSSLSKIEERNELEGNEEYHKRYIPKGDKDL